MSGLLGAIGAVAGNYFLPGSGAVIGGLLGGALDGDQSTNGGAGASSQSASRDPWGPAQPYLLAGLKRTQALQNQYDQTPFNPQQIQAYSNLFNDTNNFRQNVMPGLLGFANQGMSGGYQRGGSTLTPFQQQAQAAGGGSHGGPFGMTQPSGLLDLNGPQYNLAKSAQNQINADAIQSAQQTPQTPTATPDPDYQELLTWYRKMRGLGFGVNEGGGGQ